MTTFVAKQIVKPIVIPISTDTSNAVDIKKGLLCGIIGDPTAFTGTDFKIQTAPTENGTYRDIVNEVATAIYAAILPSVGDQIQLDPNLTAGLGWVKIVSQNTEAAERTLQLVIKEAS